jgi:hypothetical protein
MLKMGDRDDILPKDDIRRIDGTKHFMQFSLSLLLLKTINVVSFVAFLNKCGFWSLIKLGTILF